MPPCLSDAFAFQRRKSGILKSQWPQAKLFVWFQLYRTWFLTRWYWVGCLKQILLGLTMNHKSEHEDNNQMQCSPAVKPITGSVLCNRVREECCCCICCANPAFSLPSWSTTHPSGIQQWGGSPCITILIFIYTSYLDYCFRLVFLDFYFYFRIVWEAYRRKAGHDCILVFIPRIAHSLKADLCPSHFAPFARC